MDKFEHIAWGDGKIQMKSWGQYGYYNKRNILHGEGQRSKF